MAASAMSGVACLQLGPRQGVYCRPSVVLTAVPGGGYQQQFLAAGGGRLKWRLSQFRSPENSYRLRARVDTEQPPPENIPQIAGRIIERPSSALGQHRAAVRPPAKMTKSRSSCNLHFSTSSGALGLRQQHTSQQMIVGAGKLTQTSSGPNLQEKHKRSNTAPAFSIQACSVNIQSRPLARSLTAPPKKIAPPAEPFPYPDPVQVGGDHAFNVRLAEMAGLQRETVKLEEFRARISRRNAAAATATSSSTSNLQSNNPQQPASRPSSGVTRPSVTSRPGLSRRTSLPAGPPPTVQDKPPPLPEPVKTATFRRKPTSQTLANLPECKSASSISDTPKPGSTVEDQQIHTTQQTDATSDKTDERDTELPETTAENPSKLTECAASVVENTALDRKEVVPKSHHRELVEAIFSGATQEKSGQNEGTGEQVNVLTPGGPNNDRVPASSTARKSEPSGTSGVSPSTKPAASSATKSSPTRPKSSKSKTIPTPKALPETLSAGTPPISPTNELSPPSSASSSSITSEHSSRPASGKKAHSKSSKTRKTHKKAAGRHRHT